MKTWLGVSLVFPSSAILALATIVACGDSSGEGASSSSGGAGTGASTGDGGFGAGYIAPAGPQPVMFVTQVPTLYPTAVVNVFGNHLGSLVSVARGGDLWIRYPDGALRNLTEEAGFGQEGLQGYDSIAVRQPSVSWDGKRALFSMVIGGANEQFEVNGPFYWQIYEVTGLGQDEAVSITKVPGQPEEYNNVAPFYGTDDRVLFVTDLPRSGERHLYPQRDEYESYPTTTGIVALDPESGVLTRLNHAPSGVFYPSIDSFGRVLFTNWDHLQRDQQAENDYYGAFNYDDESEGASEGGPYEMFPEPRYPGAPDLPSNVTPHTFNQFFPWEMSEDGSALETLNHVGRDEIGYQYTHPSFRDDPSLQDLTPEGNHQNRLYIRHDGGLFHLLEDPEEPGVFYATHAREFFTDQGGEIVRFVASPGTNPEEMVIEHVIGTRDPAAEEAFDPAHPGFFRNPVPLFGGKLIASHSTDGRASKNEGSFELPSYRQNWRIKLIEKTDGGYVVGGPLTPGIQKSLQWWAPDALITWSGELWELDPVEVRARPRPKRRSGYTIGDPELSIFAEVGVDPNAFSAAIAEEGLALVVSRNITARDRSDIHQPYNLRVPGGVETLGPIEGPIYDVPFMQFLQADQVRGYVDGPGRRVLAMPMHDETATPYVSDEAPAPGSARVGPDGSVAALVPANRAMTWQLTDPNGEAIVRERNWVSFAPGELRACPTCHGLNTVDQAGRGLPENPPEALRDLLIEWQNQH